MRSVLSLVGVALVAYLGVCLLMFLSQRSLMYFPQPQRALPDAPLLRFTNEGADLLVSTANASVGDAVMYLGGNAEDVSLSLPELAAAFPQRAIYALHYRGYGGSSGSASEAALVSDAQALLGQLHDRHRRVTLVGRSLGSGIAVQLAARQPVDRLVLITPFDSIARIAAAQFPYLPTNWLLQDRYDAGAVAAAVTTPTTLVVAGADEIIPRASSERLLSSFRDGVARMIVIEGAGHNDLSMHPGYGAALGSGGN